MKYLALGATLVGALVLTGCVMPEGRIQPLKLRLSDEILTVNFSDGSTCQAAWRNAPQGKFTDCAGDFTYIVKPEERVNILADIGQGLNKELGSSLVSPLAKITLADASGRRYEFESTTPIRKYDYWNKD